jgi:hypothetical protein
LILTLINPFRIRPAYHVNNDLMEIALLLIRKSQDIFVDDGPEGHQHGDHRFRSTAPDHQAAAAFDASYTPQVSGALVGAVAHTAARKKAVRRIPRLVRYP